VMSPGKNGVVIGGGCGSKKARPQDCRRRRIKIKRGASELTGNEGGEVVIRLNRNLDDDC
jgi:hypothetical protein